MPRRQSASRGFTLAELLAVVGIVAVLVAILMPALSSAREQARRVWCLSNLRTLTSAWLAYASSNQGRICGASTGSPSQPGFHDWVASADTANSLEAGMLWPYVTSPRIYKCPNDQVNLLHTYAINSWLDGEGPPAPGDPAPAQCLSRVRCASETFVFIERLDPSGSNNKSFVVPPYPGQDWIDLPALGLHGQAGVISFADGHAMAWNWNDPGIWHGPTGPGPPQDADLLQAQKWIGHGPYPP